jgi:formate hydrogenlyase subunit 6/NADH:ubiquinone oxidoreductase subunit I
MKILPFLPELLSHIFKKPATVKYPFEKLAVPKRFRGTPVLIPARCTACKICQLDCPAEAIEIVPVAEAEKKFKMTIHNDRCVHCEQCVESCPQDAMTINQEFELAVFDRRKLKIEYVYTKAAPIPKPKTETTPS